MWWEFDVDANGQAIAGTGRYTGSEAEIVDTDLLSSARIISENPDPPSVSAWHEQHGTEVWNRVRIDVGATVKATYWTMETIGGMTIPVVREETLSFATKDICDK